MLFIPCVFATFSVIKFSNVVRTKSVQIYLLCEEVRYCVKEKKFTVFSNKACFNLKARACVVQNDVSGTNYKHKQLTGQGWRAT